ncbi:hypothetical protein RBA41_05090 [Massilia sp. CCM 9210]|uniref:hypothetical protein n=1 Tax=Massilia scottii TaxID=3057166 RepID=UPI002796DAA6|nr:hypothetical protein [Massilia sp. CCM 9210]MDQ1812675.1 hypothetical protein [Massilia sp. CCM 9210]
MIIEPRFDEHNVRKVEAILLDHPIARDYFQGELYDTLGHRLNTIALDLQDGGTSELNEKQSARLFMMPDGSIARSLHLNEHGNAPSGINIQSTNSLVMEGEQNSVIAFRSETTPGVWSKALHIDQMMLRSEAPSRFGTVAFGLMVVTAYRLGFSHIQLFAAGRGPLQPDDPDALVGYWVWPKLGFDAAVNAAEISRHPSAAMHGLRTVQEVTARTPEWWKACGSARPMLFDLRSNSPSWSILLNYLCTTVAAF